MDNAYQNYYCQQDEVCNECGVFLPKGSKCYVSLDFLICPKCFYRIETMSEMAYDDWRENQEE